MRHKLQEKHSGPSTQSTGRPEAKNDLENFFSGLDGDEEEAGVEPPTSEKSAEELIDEDVTKTINAMFRDSLQIDWHHYLSKKYKAQEATRAVRPTTPINKYLTKDNVDLLKGKTSSQLWMHFGLLTKMFDPLDWWLEVGRVHYPLIFPLALIRLAVPDSNGTQERVFSSCTWIDDKLRTRQCENTFEMKVLLYRNKELIKRLQALMATALSEEEMMQRALEMVDEMFGEDGAVTESEVEEIEDTEDVPEEDDRSIEEVDCFILDALDEDQEAVEATRAVMEEMRELSLKDKGEEEEEEMAESGEEEGEG
jgi:hypothetical protein